jgi:hypothetical protein
VALETVYAMQSNELMICADVPLDASQVRQLSFADKDEQYNYFRSKAIRIFNDFKYIREHRGVKVPVNAEEIGNACYLCFKNQTSGKWYYAFVTQVIYINPETSLLNFEIDVYQTFLFDMVIRDCDISREHVANDDFKTNTVQEPVDVGDYVIAHEETFDLDKLDEETDYQFVIISAIDILADPGTLEEPKVSGAKGGMYAGLPSGARAYLVSPRRGTSSIASVMNSLSAFPWVSQSILAIYAVTSYNIGGAVTVEQSAMGFSVGVIADSSAPSVIPVGGVLANWLSKFPTYKNKKLYTSQFSFIEVVLPNGARTVLKPEFLPDGIPSVKVVGTLIPAPNLYLYTENYCGAEEDFLLNANNISGFPCFPVQNNTYPLQTAQAEATNTLVHSQNRSNIFWDTVGNVVQSVFTGDPLNVLSTGIDAYKNVRSEIQSSERDRQRIGQMQTNVSLTGASGGGLATFIASKKLEILYRWWTVKPEFAEKIEQFFDVYGYKVSRFGVPNLNSRPRYNYIKCNNVNIYGNIPNEFMQPLRNMFINGFTLWHDKNNVGTYGNNVK